MDVSGGLTLVQSVLQILESPIYTEIQSVLGVKSQLKKLKTTMSTINNILQDAEIHEQLHQGRCTHVESGKLERLKEALYQTDDLFDEVTTLAHLKQLMSGNKISEEVRLFFSRRNQLRYAFSWSREIKKIRGELDDILKDHQFVSGLAHPAGSEMSWVRNDLRERETHSFVCEQDMIIGRDNDRSIVVDMLLNDNTVDSADVFVVTIVGIGGLGKTTLAKLVYNDDKVKSEFPLKMWVCVSDKFNVETLLRKIIAAATNCAEKSDLNLDQLQGTLRRELDGKKYLLVLDDMWNEDFNEWLTLRNLLIGGGKGSRIIVTTRSKEVARVVESYMTHELKGLSEEESWNLFERITLEPGRSQIEARLVNIGKDIVRKCAGVPLALRVVGSLLKGQGERKWRYLKNTDLANLKPDEDGIMPVLKISYYYLPSHLRRCLSYCAIFPKDYEIIKEDLISLWMAQGFIKSSNAQSFEDVGEEYFMTLLNRCFFQDVERGDNGEIKSCKMHDLIHDVAQQVTEKEIIILSSEESNKKFNEKTLHLFLHRNVEFEVVESCSTEMKRMRTLLRTQFMSRISVDVLLSKMRYLRVLDLQNAGLKTLTSVVGKLLHLRYLDLSGNKFSVLPSSITQLYNLQTLKLCNCHSLKELPRDLSKLVNLRHLDIYGCDSLTHMPPGMNKMRSLHKLTMFVVSGKRSDWIWGSAGISELGDLENFTNHTDIMKIVIQEGVRYNEKEASRKGGFLLNNQHREIQIHWRGVNGSERNNNAEAMLQALQPHPILRKLYLYFYPGVSFQIWSGSSMNIETYLPNLVEVVLNSCARLEHLPLLSQLRHLKSLGLGMLRKLEYVENSSRNRGDGGLTSSSGSSRQEADDELVFFPSLETLVLDDLQELKGWWKASSESGEGERKEGNEIQSFSYSFPRLSHLEIMNCEKLTAFPGCPKLEELKLASFNGALWPICRRDSEGGPVSPGGLNHNDDASSSNNTCSSREKQQQEEEREGRLRKVRINNVKYLNSLQTACLSSLCFLDIWECKELKTLSGQGVWYHLTALETLALNYLDELKLNDDKDDMPWRCLGPTLRSLTLRGLPKLVKLPKGMQHLTALHSLAIHFRKRCVTSPPCKTSI